MKVYMSPQKRVLFHQGSVYNNTVSTEKELLVLFQSRSSILSDLKVIKCYTAQQETAPLRTGWQRNRPLLIPAIVPVVLILIAT